MTFLLDTNVVSELRKPPGRIDPGVEAWANGTDRRSMYVSVVTILEIELGILRLERRDAAQGKKLRTWMDEGVLAAFRGRILPIDLVVARRAALLHVPDPRPERDAFIAATGEVHGYTVVTRNLSDFSSIAVPVLDPWHASA